MKPSDPPADAVEAAAAQWLARRDRALSPAEQDAYLEWLREHPSHADAIARLEQAWARLDGLGRWQPSHSASPNPDLLAPARHARRRWVGVFALAAALVVAGILVWETRHISAGDSRTAKVLPGAERVVLEDGSLVELNTGARIEAHFSRDERRVRLVSGEAHFTVMKHAERPFIVDSGRYEVRAVGTAFCVELRAGGIAILVTEGQVRMDGPVGAAGSGPAREPLVPRLTAGQQAIVAAAGQADAGPEIVVRDMAPAEMDSVLAWRALRLEFDEVPLREVIAEFNRFNSRQLVLGDAETGAIVVGGSFRADNLDAFVRLLDTGFDVAAVEGDRDIVLRRRR